MRKLAALLLAAALLTPTLVLAQQPAATPAVGDTSGQPIQATTALAASSILDRGIAAMNAGQFDEAMIDASLFILLNPMYPRGYHLRGLTYFNQKNAPAALNDLSKAVTLAESDPTLQAQIYSDRARVYVTTNQLSNAVDDVTSALKIAPSAILFEQRATLKANQRDLRGAIADMDQAVKLAPDTAGLFLVRGSLYDLLGSPPDAASDYLEWIRLQGAQQVVEHSVNPPVALQLDMSADKFYIVPINAKKGQNLGMAAVKASGTVDPLIVLITTEGVPLIANDDVSSNDQNAVIRSYTAPADGVYLLIVSHAGGGSDGQVQVQVVAQ